MDAGLKILTAGMLLAAGLTGAAFIVPLFGSGGNADERPNTQPARVLLSPVIVPVGDGSQARAVPKPIQLILTVREHGVARVCSLEPRIHDALLVHGVGTNGGGLRALVHRGLGGAGEVLDAEIHPGPPILAGHGRREGVDFDYRCASGESQKVR